MELVETAAAEVEQRGRRALRVASDVSDRASLQRVLDETIRDFGKRQVS